MAFDLQKPYAPDLAQRLRQDDQSLSAQDRRRCAAVEALTRGHGGTPSMATLLGGDPPPIPAGLRERKPWPDDPAGKRVRQPGGGRKQTEAKHPAWLQHVHDTIKARIAGAPLRDDGLWRDVTPQAIPDRLHAHGVCAGPRLVRRLLDTLGLARRQSAKGLRGGDAPQRAAPWRPLGHLIQALLAAGNPVVRIETKKQDCLGTLSRHGKVYGQQALQALDHDGPRLARGGIMPHGISDLAQHPGGMHGGLSRDTTAFACESLRWVWDSDGRRLYPNASAIWLWCDGGGRNRGHTPRCKEDLQAVVNDLAVPIRVAPYPAYGSQFNPSERRLLSHVTSACQGVRCAA